MKRLLTLLIASTLCAADAPRLLYSRSFPGSVPAYFDITLEKSGDAVYGEGPQDEVPLRFRLTPAETAQVYALAEKLEFFKRTLESPAKVAFMGTKTFRYEDGTRKGEVQFNYTEDLDARALQDWFERMAESAARRIDLERSAKYDKLGVHRSLVLLNSALERGRLVAPEQFLPMLDRVAKNETYMHQARALAAAIAEAVRGAKPQPQP